jgi:RecA/RadA recombinase
MDMVAQQLDDIQDRGDGNSDRERRAYIPTGLRDLDDLLDGGCAAGS